MTDTIYITGSRIEFGAYLSLILLKAFWEKREKRFETNFPSKISIFWKKVTAIFGYSPFSPARPSDKSIIIMKMTMKHWWNDSDRIKPNLLGWGGVGGNLVLLSLCQPQILNKRCPGSNPRPPQRETGHCPPWAMARLKKAELVCLCSFSYRVFSKKSGKFGKLLRTVSRTAVVQVLYSQCIHYHYVT